MTSTDFTAGFALIPIAIGLLVAAETWRPTVAKKPKVRPVTTRDEHLRACGWRIYCRPRSGVDRWEWRRGPGIWFNVPTEEAVSICPLVLGGWERTSLLDRGERVWVMRGGEGGAVLVLRQSDAITQAARIMEKYAAMIDQAKEVD